MKTLKRILYFILGLVVLLCAFVLLCAVNPDFTDRLTGFLYPDNAADRTEISGIADAGNRQPGSAAEIDGGDADTGHPADTYGIAGDGQDAQAGSDGAGGSGVRTDPPQSGSDMLSVDSASGYTPPERTELTIPERVSGRNGYEPVREQEEQLDEDAAGQIRNSLGTGETGDGLSFDPLYYPYYAMLDEKGKHLYRQIYANAGSCNRAFAPVEEVSAGQLSDVFSAVYNDHPELFWLNTAYSCKYVRGGFCVEIDLEFNRTAQNMEGALTQFTAEAERILSVAEGLGSDYEKERYVHDALIGMASYDLGAEMNQSAYSALVNGRTVCAGYARACQYLMQRLGIPCYYCTGYAGENHAWNIVMLDNEFYNVDVTWDDTDGGNYDYFNRTDGDFADTHIRQDLAVYLPPCNGQTYRGQEEAGTEPVGEEVLHSASEYYDYCFNRIVTAGIGSYEFEAVIEGESLLQEVYAAYEGEDYRAAYFDRAMDTIGAVSCNMVFDVAPLMRDRYLITHRLEIR